MPHDKNGNSLSVGDEVIVRMIVTSINTEQPDYCNVCGETLEPMFPGENKSSVWFNAKQVEKVEPAE